MKQPTQLNAIVNNDLTLENISTELDMVRGADGAYHILQDGKGYQAELLRADATTKTYEIKVNGVRHTVQLEDEYDQLVKKLGLTVASAAVAKDIHAPMPGLVLEVSVSEGQEVEAGTPLLILEAMKMENVIKCPGDGVVKTVKVQQGAAVEKGQLLVELE